jgi:hypothetical protein
VKLYPRFIVKAKEFALQLPQKPLKLIGADGKPTTGLALAEIVDGLIADGLIAAAEAERFKRERRYFKGEAHPLSVIAEQKWKSLRAPQAILNMDALTRWLARRANLDYFHIDPLKINFSAVTDVMSSAYATRYRILPVEVTSGEVVIATAEPYEHGWEEELRPILRKDIRVGDSVVIQKAGEIIPQVVRVETEARDGSETLYVFPTKCPSCGGEVVRLEDEVDFVVGTFSKSVGAIGGFGAGNHPMFEILRYAMRPYMFTASSSPATIATSLAAVKKLAAEPWRRERLRENSARLFHGFKALGLDMGCDVVEHGLSNSHAIIGACAAAKFIESDFLGNR